MVNDVEMNGDFTYAELQNVIKHAKNNKAPGFGEIPVDVLKKPTACSYLLRLFNIYVFQWARSLKNGQNAC